jgi:hypothetical protein
MKLSLRTKILWLVAASTAALAALVLGGLAILARHQIDRMVRHDVRAAGAVLTQLVHERSETLTGQCRLLALQPVLKAVIGTGDPATVLDTARDARQQIDADCVMITE